MFLRIMAIYSRFSEVRNMRNKKRVFLIEKNFFPKSFYRIFFYIRNAYFQKNVPQSLT